jgi:hypothetical protein
MLLSQEGLVRKEWFSLRRQVQVKEVKNVTLMGAVSPLPSVSAVDDVDYEKGLC